MIADFAASTASTVHAYTSYASTAHFVTEADAADRISFMFHDCTQTSYVDNAVCSGITGH